MNYESSCPPCPAYTQAQAEVETQPQSTAPTKVSTRCMAFPPAPPLQVWHACYFVSFPSSHVAMFGRQLQPPPLPHQRSAAHRKLGGWCLPGKGSHLHQVSRGARKGPESLPNPDRSFIVSLQFRRKLKVKFTGQLMSAYKKYDLKSQSALQGSFAQIQVARVLFSSTVIARAHDARRGHARIPTKELQL